MSIYRSGNFAVIDTGVKVYSAEITEDRTPFSGVQPFYTADAVPMEVMGEKLVPYGANNNLPAEMRELLDTNHIVPEQLNKKVGLIWGQGPAMYTVRFEKGKRIKEWLIDTEIQSFLNDWDYELYLQKAAIEFSHAKGHFTKYFRNRAPRIGGKAFITHLEHSSVKKTRLEWPDDADNINHIFTGKFDRLWKPDLRKYPVFDHFDPFRNRVSMHYSNLYDFALDNRYSRPALFGSFNWIKLQSSLPVLINNFNANAASIRHHIKTPALYWNLKADQLKKNCELSGIEYKDEMLEDLKDETFLEFAKGLVGIEKAGKMLTSETIWDELGQQYVGWEVITLDQKVKDYITAQIEIAKRAVYEITAAMGLHPALSNLSADGNLPSGSEQLYAFKLFQHTSTEIPEGIICRDLNYAIKANFPKKDVKIGFYHDVLLTEESTSPKDRIKNS